MRTLTPEETAGLDELEREQAELRARLEAKLQRWQEREKRRRRLHPPSTSLGPAIA
jgi:hypothetical protein